MRIDKEVGKKYLVLFFLLSSNLGYAQTDKLANTTNSELKYFVSSSFGIQMSGIKSEDFISSNYSPLLNVTAGKWFTPSLALQIGYKGFYFNTISDNQKHHYSFLYGEAVINVNSFFKKYNPKQVWRLYLHGGPGFFYNFFYSRPNICANIGVQNTFRLNSQLYANFDIAAIVGWDIYQGDKDILPGILVGLTYLF